jgi:iron complex outermembrane recepter protein
MRPSQTWYTKFNGGAACKSGAFAWRIYNQSSGDRSMKLNPKISAAVGAILSAPASMIAYAAAADTASDTAADAAGLQEVVVTANRRAENLQDVPITIQAISGSTLQQLNITGFDELLKYTPNVTYSGNGPGTGNIFMRGLGGVGSGNQSQSTTAPFPNVALYLDDQSMQFPARNNNVYLVDMQRVEILEGPQGTLFGGGAQAGVIRYITNKPKLGVTEGEVNASYGVTAGGDPNSSGNFTLNLPFGDNLALRAVVFTEHDGGWIDNVPGTIQTTPLGNGSDSGNIPPGKNGLPTNRPGSAIATNAGLIGNNLNDSTTGGARLSLLYKFNENWDILLQQNYQNMEANGYFYEYPNDSNGKPLASNQLTAFTPAFNKDKYASTAWTVNGAFAGLKAVYTGSYMTRSIDGQQDYSNYMKSKHGSYYACSGKGAGYQYFRSTPKGSLVTKPTSCYAPVGSWRDQVRNTHVSHEFRLSTNEEYRLRGLAGAYYEMFNIYDDMNFNYMGIPQCSPQNLAISQAGGPDCVTTVGPVFPGAFAWHPGYRTDTNTAFGEDVLRGYKQFAFFLSTDFDIIPKVLTVSGGARHYDYQEFEHGSEYFSSSSSVLNLPSGTCTHCGWPITLNKSESGWKGRANLTWHVTQDIMGYYTWSQGFRPGGFNRTHTSLDGSVIKPTSEAPYTYQGSDLQYSKPYQFVSDNLTNNEVGIKSEWLQHRLIANVSVYQMDWKSIQVPLFDPSILGNTTFVVNGPSYKVKGIELQLVARLFEGFTVQGSSSWNSSEQTTQPCLASNLVSASNPTPIGQCITHINSVAYNNPFGSLGSRAPFSPAVEFNVRARYDWAMSSYNYYAWAGANHIGAQNNEPGSFTPGDQPSENPPTTTYLLYKIPGYTTYDAAVGVAKDAWNATLSVQNLSNSDAVSNISSGQFIKAEVPIRPRIITFGMGYKF